MMSSNRPARQPRPRRESRRAQRFRAWPGRFCAAALRLPAFPALLGRLVFDLAGALAERRLSSARSAIST
jgi:hypothetical protein